MTPRKNVLVLNAVNELGFKLSIVGVGNTNFFDDAFGEIHGSFVRTLWTTLIKS